jgi:hypothetical protein
MTSACFDSIGAAHFLASLHLSNCSQLGVAAASQLVNLKATLHTPKGLVTLESLGI